MSTDEIELREPRGNALLWLLIGAGGLAVAGMPPAFIWLEPSYGESVALGVAFAWMALLALVVFVAWRRWASIEVGWRFAPEGLVRLVPGATPERFAWEEIASAETGTLRVDTMERHYLRVRLHRGRVLELGYAGLDTEVYAALESFAGLVSGEIERRARDANRE